MMIPMLIIGILFIVLFIISAVIQERYGECYFSKHPLKFHKYKTYTYSEDPGKYWRKFRKKLGLDAYHTYTKRKCIYCLKEKHK